MMSLFSLSGCDQGKPVSSLSDIQFQKISLNNLTITQLGTELSLAVYAKTLNQKATNFDSPVIWESSDESLASVDAAGNVMARAPGKVRLSANYGELTETIMIDINETGVSIQGRLRYEDKPYDASGFVSDGAPPVYNDIRYATVDLLSEHGSVLESTTSDSRGLFVFGHVIPAVFSIRVLAQVKGAPAAGFSIKDSVGATYAIGKASISGKTHYDITLSKNFEAAGAFNMLDVFVSAAEYTRESFAIDVAELSVYWQANSIGTFYCNGFDAAKCKNGPGIYVLNQPGDTDHFDDDVLLHEFGHFIETQYLTSDSLGGCHFLTDNDLDLRLAWGEGWGTFFASAVKRFVQETAPEKLSSTTVVTGYLDTDGEKVGLMSYNLLSPPFEFMGAKADSFYYASSQFAVSNILWSVLDVYGMERISDVLLNHFPESVLPVNLPNFWQGLLLSDLWVEGDIVGLSAIFSDRKVIYQQDPFENGDVLHISDAVNVDYTLYKNDLSSDVDLFAFDVEAEQSYVITTHDLRNGIDTYLRILDENGEVVVMNNRRLENDDADIFAHYRYNKACNGSRYFNDANALVSRLEFTAMMPNRYYIEVSHIPAGEKRGAINSFGATGPYGSYRLSVE